ncbi:MAG: hypothetical protein AAF942_04265 [Pseudomonadota bacterium]
MASRADAASPGGVTRVSKTLQIVLWITILTIAFFMQVVPFLLVLTMVNLAFGVTSATALILLPVAAFAMLSFACWIATRRTRNMFPAPLPQAACFTPYMTGKGKEEPLTPQQRMITVLQQWRYRRV